MKSAAVVNYAETKGSVELREIEQPEIGNGEVLLEVANVAGCVAVILHQWTADHMLAGQFTRWVLGTRIRW